MKATLLQEPELEFGGNGRHIDPRFGVADYGPVDLGSPGAPKTIRVGIVGPSDGVAGAREWLERCREPIPSKPGGRSPRLFRDFPGFSSEETFRSSLAFNDATTRALSGREMSKAMSKTGALAVVEIVDLYAHEISDLAASNRCDVIICPRPDELEDGESLARNDMGRDEASVEVNTRSVDFHDLLKARVLGTAPPLQLIRSSTWDPSRARHRRAGKRSGLPSQIQDEATRAWNIHTALYYKAGGAPWRLVRTPGELPTLFVGVSFFHTSDRHSVHTSVAQVFNERGDGVVVRGGPAARNKDDRQPHLAESDAESLLTEALSLYRREHHNFPARVVLHKTSEFDDSEISGFGAAADGLGIAHLDLIWVQSSEGMRLFRDGQHAVLRGTYVDVEDKRGVLFTRGSIEFYRLYPGMYVPVPLGLRVAVAEHRTQDLAAEILALSKMNWNQSQLDGRLPITLRAAAQVANVIKHVPPGTALAPRYASYI